MVQSNTLYAPKTGLYHPYTSNNYVSTPNHASVNFTGDFSLVIEIKHSWSTNTIDSALVSKWTSGQEGWFFYVDGSPQGALSFLLHDGTGLKVFVGPTLNLNDLVKHSIAITVDLDNGSSGTTVYFWTKNSTGVWYLKGSSTLATASVIKSNTSSLLLSSYNVGGAPSLAHTIYSAQIYDGIGDNSAPGLGTLVAEADFSYPWANNKYTDATGKVWTINGSAWAWEYQDDPEDKYTPTPEIWGGDAYQLIDDQINNSSSALHVLNGGNARGY